MSADQPQKPLVLVVEEEEAIRSLLGLVLRARGFAVLLAASGKEALELCRSRCGEIDALLIDVGMTGMDGPQTLAALRHLAPSVPCCFMTGGEVGERFSELGVARVFTKPFALNDVSDTLWQLVGS